MRIYAMLKTVLEAPRPSQHPLLTPAASAREATAGSAQPRVVAAAALQISFVRASSLYTSPGYGFSEYTFTVRNDGPLVAEEVQVTGVSLIVAGGSPQTATEEAATFLTRGGTSTALHLGTLAPGDAKSVTVLCAATPFNTCAGSEVRVRARGAEDGACASSPGFF